MSLVQKAALWALEQKRPITCKDLMEQFNLKVDRACILFHQFEESKYVDVHFSTVENKGRTPSGPKVLRTAMVYAVTYTKKKALRISVVGRPVNPELKPVRFNKLSDAEAQGFVRSSINKAYQKNRPYCGYYWSLRRHYD